MEIAYRRALDKQDEPEESAGASSDSKSKTAQKDIIARTLEHKARSK
jgi:hypothetical protein